MKYRQKTKNNTCTATTVKQHLITVNSRSEADVTGIMHVKKRKMLQMPFKALYRQKRTGDRKRVFIFTYISPGPEN